VQTFSKIFGARRDYYKGYFLLACDPVPFGVYGTDILEETAASIM
jgi:hypothetical protein